MTEEAQKTSIVGVEIKPLRAHGDERGFFCEIIRFSDPFFKERGAFGQWSHSRMAHTVVKAWHYHHLQIDWWYIGLGQIEAVLIDHRPESPSYQQKMVFPMGDTDDSHRVCVKIPPGVLHGCKVVSKEAHLFYITSELYNPQDEGRIPFDSDSVEHDWGRDIIVAENDRRLFIPALQRRIL